MGHSRDFGYELMTLLNKYSMENGSDTPEFILCDYLIDCLKALDHATNIRSKWYEGEVEETVTQ